MYIDVGGLTTSMGALGLVTRRFDEVGGVQKNMRVVVDANRSKPFCKITLCKSVGAVLQKLLSRTDS